MVGGVEISLDSGTTWHPASGRENWTYSWTPTVLGSFTLETRATDDSGNIEIPSNGTAVITVNPPDCPCSDWSSSTVPGQVDSGDASAGEYGVRFRSDFDGYITGIRFYKASTNTGTHIGNLWSNSGGLLATATFTNESSSGWQQGELQHPRGDHGQYYVRCVIFHAIRTLLRRTWVLCDIWGGCSTTALS